MLTKYDSLGAQQLPDDPPKIFVAWNGEWIYKGDEYFTIDGDRVPVDELADYITDTYGKAMRAE